VRRNKPIYPPAIPGHLLAFISQSNIVHLQNGDVIPLPAMRAISASRVQRATFSKILSVRGDGIEIELGVKYLNEVSFVKGSIESHSVNRRSSKYSARVIDRIISFGRPAISA